MNQEEWHENTLQEFEEQVFSTSHTPVPQEKVEKRPMETISPSVAEISATDFIVYNKRQKTMDVGETQQQSTEQEQPIILIGSYISLVSNREDTIPIYPMTSLTIDTHVSSPIGDMEQRKKDHNIFSIYNEIKEKIQALKATTFSQFQKQTTTTQHRLLSSFDTKKRKMQVAFLERKLTQPRSANDYKKSIFSFDTYMIHPIDQMDFHKHSCEMVYNTFTNSIVAAAKLQVSVNNIQ